MSKFRLKHKETASVWAKIGKTTFQRVGYGIYQVDPKKILRLPLRGDCDLFSGLLTKDFDSFEAFVNDPIVADQLGSFSGSLAPKLRKAFQYLTEKHTTVYWVDGYENKEDIILMLDEAPKKISKYDDSRDFKYGVLTIDVKTAGTLIFHLSH